MRKYAEISNRSKDVAVAELTDEQIKREDEFMKGIPRLNIGALFVPPVWGPAHGIWATILFYPLWLFADNALYAAYTQQTVLAFVVALVLVLSLAIGTVVFAILSQPYAAHRAIDQKGMSKEQYLKREKIWAIVCVILGIAMLAWATYYNLVVRPTLG
ncbi:MAG: viscotoxin-A3 [Raoultibacter sp.]|jgi:hypothetical protein